MGTFRFVLCALAALMFAAPGIDVASAQTEKRVALVIGNSAYRHAPKLANPANDAGAVSALLKSAGFEVVEMRENLGVNDMRRAIRDFSDRTREADIAVVFYAGHGIEVSGNNYLIPVDAALERDIDVEDETVSLERVLTVLEPAKRLRLVILDACRDNPFARSMKRTMASRAIGRGLARVEPTSSDTLIAFAAKAGSTAADGDNIHSPFTAALLKHISTPGLDLRIAFGRVRDEVLRSTKNKQEPFVYGSLGGTTVALVSPSGDAVPQPPAGESGASAQIARDYELAARLGSKEAWEVFLTKYPTGFYADLARVHRSKLSAAVPNVRPKDLDQRQKPVAPLPAESVSKGKLTKSARENTCGLSAASCEETKRVIRNAVASGRGTAADYRGASQCGCGLPNQPKLSLCAGLRQDVANWRSQGVPESHPGMVGAAQNLKQCGG